jgi:hypothetical protein
MASHFTNSAAKFESRPVSGHTWSVVCAVFRRPSKTLAPRHMYPVFPDLNPEDFMEKSPTTGLT